jgi:hypothetical protein
MTSDSDPRTPPPAGTAATRGPAGPAARSAAEEKADRLAAALRENLRRRKDQARRRAGDPATSTNPVANPVDDGGKR